MIIKIDVREHELLSKIKQLVLFIPIFKKLEVVSENLPIGDFIICDDKEDKLVIERKSITDLLASIKDGRYEEQSYRLNGLDIHNHNIIYLIEGDVNKTNKFKSNGETEKLTSYSAMFSLNYFKGFSVFRSFNIDETAILICNMAYKLEKDTRNAFYSNNPFLNNTKEKDEEQDKDQDKDQDEEQDEEQDKDQDKEQDKEQEEEQDKEVNHDKDYINVVKKVKKENITVDNIDEIMLCQIPGISSLTAITIIQKFKTLSNLLKEIENNPECLKDISYINSKGQSRKINKTCAGNIVKFLLKK
jgi:ERCC4-type nuclease